MIISRITGGLGNQMFAYAIAKAQAIKFKDDLYLDVDSSFANYFYKHKFELDIFNVSYNKANKWFSFTFPLGHYVRFIFRKIPRLFKFLGITYFFEYDFSKYEPRIEKLNRFKMLFLEGYWQSEKYFDNIKDIIKNDFEFKVEISKESRDFAKLIENYPNAVCIHARRLHAIPKLQELIPIKGSRDLGADYYFNAIAEIKESVDNPHFFCFSDYPKWFEENFQSDPNFTIVYINGYNDCRAYEDLWLMRKCKHFIICNSTFSWWAAWLSERKESIIISPDIKFWECKDIIPNRWRKL